MSKEKEYPYLLWLSKEELEHALYHLIRLKKPGSKSAMPLKDLEGDYKVMHRIYQRFFRKLNYVSHRDQDVEEQPLGPIRFRQNAVELSQMKSLIDLFRNENPDKELDQTSVEEFFYWYSTQVHEGRKLKKELPPDTSNQ